MQPSDIYESTEVTVNGFKYKKTNATVADIFTLNASIDNSIAYTEPLTGDFSNVSMWGWKNTSDAYYIQKSLVWGYSYKSSASATQDNAYNRVNKIEINYGDFNFSGVPYIVFAENGGGNAENYTFGYSPEATGVNNNGTLNSHSLVTDFEVNKTIWTIGNLQGITTAEAGLYLNDGTETAEHNIDVEQFLANPSGYLITKFSIGNRCTWDEDNNEWITNGSVHFCPCILFDSAETSGIYSLNQGPSGGATVSPSATGNLGFAGKFSVELWNNRQDNSTAVPKMDHPNKTFHRAFQNSYTLGSNADNLVIEPKADPMGLTNSCEVGDTGDFYIGYDTLNNTSSYLQCYQHDYYKMIKDYTGAAKSHLTSYKKYITTFLKGDLVSKLIASCGVFFTQMTAAELNTAGCTPTHMDIDGLHLGEMDDAGFTTGNWINGEDIDDYTGPNKDGSIIHTGFHPGPPGPSGTDEDSTSVIPTTGAPFATGLAHYYITTAASTVLQDIADAMSTWDIDATKKDLYRNLISCKLVKPPAPVPSTPGLTFTIYGVAPEKDGNTITITGVAGNPTASFGPYSISRKFGDFRDYAPYSKAEIFLPYCGWCALPSHVIGRSVSVSYYTDIIAATCKAIVYCGANPVAEAAGVIGLDIPFAAENVGAKMEAANAGLLATASGGLQTAIGVGTMVATKGQSGGKQVMSGLSQYISGFTQMSMAANENWTEICGKTGDGCNIAGLRAIVIKITRPKYGTGNQAPTYTPPGYGHAMGYTSMKNVTVGSVRGLLIADNVDTSGISGATDAERAEIRRVLESGLIVNAAPE